MHNWKLTGGYRIMKFFNRKGREIELDLRANTQSNEPILTQNGAGQAINFDQCSSEEHRAIISNTKNILV